MRILATKGDDDPSPIISATVNGGCFLLLMWRRRFLGSAVGFTFFDVNGRS